ncbi:hypothetical protein AAFF_G00149930 [Aldrovandia affinis]|uniref:Uncharacterized protein n=1 Tax=Aldrovandia affinis TaxID=143900 RepID=A0AAD7RP80_9TELE|nr:hypothetical protein AAFF_G00149930 [Aldrovandia affinis]
MHLQWDESQTQPAQAAPALWSCHPVPGPFVCRPAPGLDHALSACLRKVTQALRTFLRASERPAIPGHSAALV